MVVAPNPPADVLRGTLDYGLTRDGLRAVGAEAAGWWRYVEAVELILAV